MILNEKLLGEDISSLLGEEKLLSNGVDSIVKTTKGSVDGLDISIFDGSIEQLQELLDLGYGIKNKKNICVSNDKKFFFLEFKNTSLHTLYIKIKIELINGDRKIFLVNSSGKSELDIDDSILSGLEGSIFLERPKQYLFPTTVLANNIYISR